MAEPLSNGVVDDPDGIRDKPHDYTPVGRNCSDGFCRVCGADSRDRIHSGTAGWPWR